MAPLLRSKKRIIYENKDKKNRLMRIDELHKFSDGTLDDVRTALNDRLKGIRMEYLPQTFWSQRDKANARAMIQAIDKRLKTRRIMRSLERLSSDDHTGVTYGFYKGPYDLSYVVLILQRCCSVIEDCHGPVGRYAQPTSQLLKVRKDFVSNTHRDYTISHIGLSHSELVDMKSRHSAQPSDTKIIVHYGGSRATQEIIHKISLGHLTSDVKSFTMKMGIQLESTSNKLWSNLSDPMVSPTKPGRMDRKSHIRTSALLLY
ncbi:hypothetical protein Tco_0511730 [Tanacetum coccineum]